MTTVHSRLPESYERVNVIAPMFKLLPENNFSFGETKLSFGDTRTQGKVLKS